jgi:kinetochore protein Nuf2
MFDNRPSIGGGGRSALLPPREKFNFPLLPIKEILICLKELGIPATEDDLTNPDKNKEESRIILERLIESCIGMSRDDIALPPLQGLQMLEFPQLHDESIPHINNFRMCQKLMETCGIQDGNFSLNDCMAPSAKRFRKQLSGIINFAKFREERKQLLAELTTERDKFTDDLSRSRIKGEDLESKLRQLRKQTEEESKIIQVIETECHELEADLNTLNERQAESREEITFLKAENNELKDAISANTLKLDDLVATKKKLQGQIVNSPERFRKQIKDTEQALNEVQTENKAAEKKIRELTAWIENIDVIQAGVDPAVEVIQDLRAEVGRQKSYVADIDSKKQELSSKRDALSHLDQNVHQLGRQSTRAEEKLMHLRKQAASRSGENQTAIEALHKKLIEGDKDRMQLAAKAERVEADAVKLDREADAEKILQEQVVILNYSFVTRFINHYSFV